MQVDNIFPLKRAFQDPPPTFISLIPKGLTSISTSSAKQGIIFKKLNIVFYNNINCVNLGKKKCMASDLIKNNAL